MQYKKISPKVSILLTDKKAHEQHSQIINKQQKTRKEKKRKKRASY